MAVIFIASTGLGSAEHTSRFLVPFLRWLRPDISPQTIAAIQFGIRKLAHLTEYAVLAILLLRAFRLQTRRSFSRQMVMVLFVAAAYAATDEFHQSFTPSRTASARDVMIDSCGALIGLALYALMRRETPALARDDSVAKPNEWA